MMTHSEYFWHISYIDTDILWLEDSTNWDESFELTILEYSLVSLLTASFFLNKHHFLDWFVKLSFLDVIFMSNTLSPKTGSATTVKLYQSTLWDSFSELPNRFLILPFLFYSDFQDLLVLMIYYTPELVLGLKATLALFSTNASFVSVPASVFDSYQDSTGATGSELTEYFHAFFPYIFIITALITTIRLIKLGNPTDTYSSRALFYLYSLATEIRFSLEGALLAFFNVFLFMAMSIVSYDDDQEELIEFSSLTCFYFFLFTFAYYLYKYSIHYFSFLESAKRGAKATSPASQSLFDLLNVVAFVLRFLVLMVRLNIYDAVDDIIDSYYIFLVDFEEEEYFSDMWFSLFSVMSFDTDVNDDRSFLLEDEMDTSTDLFTLYFIAWGRFVFYWMFFLEEMARVVLALYVTYLVIFELNAVNRSFLEDNYLTSKRPTSPNAPTVSSI